MLDNETTRNTVDKYQHFEWTFSFSRWTDSVLILEKENPHKHSYLSIRLYSVTPRRPSYQWCYREYLSLRVQTTDFVTYVKVKVSSPYNRPRRPRGE